MSVLTSSHLWSWLFFFLSQHSLVAPVTRLVPTQTKTVQYVAQSPPTTISESSISAERVEPYPTPSPTPKDARRGSTAPQNINSEIPNKATNYPVKLGGSHTDWMIAAGIPSSDWPSVDFLVSRESGWRVDALNTSSGACSLVQALPCSKLGPKWRDPVVALKWQYQYVKERYGGYAQAVAFWKIHSWY